MIMKIKRLKKEGEVTKEDLTKALDVVAEDPKKASNAEYNNALFIEWRAREHKDNIDNFMASLFESCKQVEGGWLIPNDIANGLSENMAMSFEEMVNPANKTDK